MPQMAPNSWDTSLLLVILVVAAMLVSISWMAQNKMFKTLQVNTWNKPKN